MFKFLLNELLKYKQTIFYKILQCIVRWDNCQNKYSKLEFVIWTHVDNVIVGGFQYYKNCAIKSARLQKTSWQGPRMEHFKATFPYKVTFCFWLSKTFTYLAHTNVFWKQQFNVHNLQNPCSFSTNTEVTTLHFFLQWHTKN